MAAAVSSYCVLFADDTALLVSSTNLNDTSQRLNSVLDELKFYFNVNKLLLNVKKTECLFPYEDVGRVPAVYYDSHQLTTVTSFKYLGVHIDYLFSWKVHIEHIINKVKRTIYMMYRSRYCCSTAGKKLLFTAMILPHFLYCIEVWRCCNQTLSGAVEILYRHCMRIVLGDIGFMPRLANIAVYDALDLLPLSLEFQCRCACLLFVTVRSEAAVNLKNLFIRRVAPKPTRVSDDQFQLQIPFTRSERERVAFGWWGCILWHRIPVSIRGVTNLTDFRRLYIQYLVRQLKSDVNLNRKFYDFV